MLKKISLAVFTIFIGFHTHAQDAKAKQLLDQVSSKVKSYKNMEIDFTYTLENKAENVKQETRGDVKIQGDKYFLNLMGATRLFDGKKLYTIIPEDEEITISTYKPDEDNSISPSQMLTFYEKGYVYSWDISQNVKGRKIQYIKLKPTNKNAEITEILLGIDEQTKHIYKLIQTQKNGTQITIKINSFSTNQPLPEQIFMFRKDKYEGYYINDLY